VDYNFDVVSGVPPFFKSKDKADNPKPPYKTCKFNKVIYKKSAIKLKDDGILRLLMVVVLTH